MTDFSYLNAFHYKVVLQKFRKRIDSPQLVRDSRFRKNPNRADIIIAQSAFGRRHCTVRRRLSRSQGFPLIVTLVIVTKRLLWQF